MEEYMYVSNDIDWDEDIPFVYNQYIYVPILQLPCFFCQTIHFFEDNYLGHIEFDMFYNYPLCISCISDGLIIPDLVTTPDQRQFG